MADLKSTIKIEVDGINKFLSATKQVEAELKIIEEQLKIKGLPEKEIKAQAKAIRNSMIQAQKDIEKAELERVSRVKQAQENASKIVSRLAIGRGIADFAQKAVKYFGDIIEKNKANNVELNKMSKAINSAQSLAAKLATNFLTGIAPAVVTVVDFLEQGVYYLAGWNLEQAKYIEALKLSNDEFNKEAAALIEGNKQIDQRTQAINKLNETSNVSSKLRIDATQEELELYRELVNLQSKFDTTEGDKAALREQINMKSNQFANLVKQKETELLNITKEQLLLKQKIGTLNTGEQKKLDIILDKEKAIEESLRRQEESRRKQLESIKTDLSSLKEASSDIESDIAKSISEGRLAEAQELMKTLELVNKEEEKVLEKFNQDKATLSELVIQREKEAEILDTQLKTFEAISKVVGTAIGDVGLFTEFNLDSILMNVTPAEVRKFRDQFKDLIRVDLEGNELIKIFSDKFTLDPESLKSFSEALVGTRAGLLGLFTGEQGKEFSPILGKISEDLKVVGDQFTETKKRVEELEKSINESGVSAAKTAKESQEKRLDLEKQILEKKAQIEADAGIALAKVLKDNFDILSTLGETTIFDAFFAKEQEFKVANQSLVKELQDSVTQINNLTGKNVLELTFTKAGATVRILDEELANQNSTLVNRISELATNLNSIVRVQQKELEDLGRTFTKEQLNEFANRFALEEEQLEIDLANKELLIRKAEDTLVRTRAKFDALATKENRDYNDSEISNVKNQTNQLIQLENQRFEIERELRVGAFVQELQDIERRGGDIEVEMKKFNLKEAQLTYEHWVNLANISEQGAINVTEKVRKLTSDQALQIGQQLTSAITNFVDAYISLQQTLMTNAINGINEQINAVDERISESVANIDRLESDLEGKRSGRREALLRGIEIEKEREKRLNEEKIRLQEELRQKEEEAARQRKDWAIAQAIINGAVAITNVWANSTIPYPAQAVFGGVMTGILAGITGFQIAEIESQEFAQGDILVGPSHAQGGIPFTVDGVPGYEAEGGEAIINKRSTSMFKPLLSAINEAGGGKKFADGGVANLSGMSTSLGASQFRELSMMANQPLYVSVLDINNAQGRQAKVTSITNI